MSFSGILKSVSKTETAFRVYRGSKVSSFECNKKIER